jgi:hypothetical protein
MAKKRGTEHTTLTETAQEVIDVLRLQNGVKMIAPGIINQNARGRAGKRFVTIVHTKPGFELLITGAGVQKVAIHIEETSRISIIDALKTSKRLRNFGFKERERKPGI